MSGVFDTGRTSERRLMSSAASRKRAQSGHVARWLPSTFGSIAGCSPSTIAEIDSRYWSQPIDQESFPTPVEFPRASHSADVAQFGARERRNNTGEVDTPRVLDDLVDAAREGDSVAVSELVRLTQADVFRLCSVLGSPGEVDDLVQETYLRALSSLGSFRGDAPVRAWLLSIGRRVCADHVRRRQRDRRVLEKVTSNFARDQRPGRDHTEVLLDRLSRDRREAFVATQLVGLSYEEASVVLGCPVGTVRSRVARARAELQRLTEQSAAV